MAQRAFKLDKNEQYIACHRPFKLPNGKYSCMIRVYELLEPEKQNMVTNMDWSFEPEIVDPIATTGYNSLEIDGQLVDLNKLVQDLCRSRLRVNKAGYCYFEIREGVADTTETYGFTFYRMNDMWNWGEYGVVKVGGASEDSTMNWERLDILRGGRHASLGWNHPDAEIVKELREKDSETQSLRKELQIAETRISDKDTEIQALKDQLKQFESNIEKHKEDIPTRVVPSTLFKFIKQGISGWATMEEHWSKIFKSGEFGVYTPSNEPVKGDQMYTAMTFYIELNKVFDTDNWLFMGVKELITPILVYQGSAHSVNIGGHQVFAPSDPKSPLPHNYVSGEKKIIFGLAILAGYGARMAIRLA